MKKVFLLFLGLIITSPINAQSKAEIFAKENTEKLSEILEFTETEYIQVYGILVEKENEFNILRVLSVFILRQALNPKIG